LPPSSAQESGTLATTPASWACLVVEPILGPPSSAPLLASLVALFFFLAPACASPAVVYSSAGGLVSDSPSHCGPASAAPHLTFLALCEAVLNPSLPHVVTDNRWGCHRLDACSVPLLSSGLSAACLYPHLEDVHPTSFMVEAFPASPMKTVSSCAPSGPAFCSCVPRHAFMVRVRTLRPGEGSILLVAAWLPHRSPHGVGIPQVPTHENDVGIVAVILTPLWMAKTVDCTGHHLAAIWMNHFLSFLLYNGMPPTPCYGM
jgi:hypothetical protein